uniref:Uncharacterized protein n=1 Tax=Rhizophora mucronata TaxID=61149 RepID=A0A2P2P8K3_RHIMU
MQKLLPSTFLRGQTSLIHKIITSQFCPKPCHGLMDVLEC